MSEQHKGPPAGLTGTVDHQDAGDGWLVVRLLTKQALLREGMHMDHCLGDGDYDELAGDEDLTSDAIWSLRDPDGVSRATLDVRAGVAGRRDVIMAVGPRNRRVRRSDARRLQALVAAFRAVGVLLDFAGETGLVMADDGRVMREDQAPAEVRQQSRARHEARIQAGRNRLPECSARMPVRAVSPAEYVANILRREFVSLGVDSQAVFVRSGTEISTEEWPAIHIDATVDIQSGAEAAEDAPSPERTMTAHDLKAGQWLDLDATRVTDVAMSASGLTLRYADDFEVDAAGGLVKFNRDVPGELVITFRAGIRPQRRLLTVAEWCEREFISGGGGASGSGPDFTMVPLSEALSRAPFVPEA